jgi:23S rRNA pseudouridine1911/1915/1917 synthase
MHFTVENLKMRLDKFLAEASGISRSKLQLAIEAGEVLVNGEKVLVGKHVVRKDDKVLYNPKARTEVVKKPAPLKTLYNDHGLLIIDKPPGLSVHPGAGLKGDSLTDALLYEFKDIHVVGEEDRPGIVHRLDKDTSGVMLVARTQDMYEYLKDAFAERRIKKEYIALVRGSLSTPHGRIETPIGKSKTDFRKYATKNIITPKPSLTEYWVLEHLGQGVDQYTLIRVKLHTGRTHQIRVHFSSLGHPLAGDALYGSKHDGPKGLTRQFLHARIIEVRLPDGGWIEAESPLPRDLREVLEHLHSQKVKTL